MNHSDHILKSFDEQLRQLRGDLLRIGGLVEQQMQFCVQLLAGNPEQDLTPMQTLRNRENQINELELSVSRELMQCLTMHQPMAVDARSCVSYMRISLDLERIGDELEHVAAALIELQTSELIQGEFGTSFGQLLRACHRALVRSLNALSGESEEEAKEVIDRDGEINAREQELQQRIVDGLIRQAVDVQAGIRMLQSARSLERIGDHAKNLSQAVIYVLTGEDLRDQEIEQKAGSKAGTPT